MAVELHIQSHQLFIIVMSTETITSSKATKKMTDKQPVESQT